MNPEHWKIVEDVLAAALELPAEQQAAYVQQGCNGSAEIKKEVEELLVAYQAAEKCIEPHAGKFILPEGWDDSLIGTRIGTYKLVEKIGDGGMGTVYRAERDDGEFKQVVAIKLVRAGLHDQELPRRLRTERQILALLEHPNIARLLDGGVTSNGQPYIVMEYIEGARITDYCKSHDLKIKQRLALFRQICSAVHYAHQRLVVHRDIKPSNILVGKDGGPKLLDFGIAKIVDSSAAGVEGHTLTNLNPMTPEYASPEQIQGKVLTTATDIYSLGVLLYELLTGQKPYKTAERTPQEVARLVCESEPPKPSTASTAKAQSQTGNREPISGDLDHIVLKAMRKEPGQRYASAEELSADIGNYLAGLPVQAREGSFRYRAGKFVARYKVATALSSALFVALVAGLIVVSWQVHVARVERSRAQRRFNDVRKLANSLIFEVHDGVVGLPGSTPVRKLIVQRAAEYLDSLSKESSGDADLQIELANAYIRLGQVEGGAQFGKLGEMAGAEQAYTSAQKLLQAVLDKDPARDDAGLQLVNCYRLLSALYFDTRQMEKAADAAKKGLPISQRLVDRHPENDSYLHSLAGIWFMLARIGALTDSPESRDDYHKALAACEQLLARRPDDRDRQYHVALLERALAGYVMDHGSNEPVLPHLQRALELDEKLVATGPDDADAKYVLGRDYSYLADYYTHLGHWPSALQYHQRALAMDQRLFKVDPKNMNLVERIAYDRLGIGEALQNSEQAGAAAEQYQAVIDVTLPLAQKGAKGFISDYLGSAYEGMGNVKSWNASHASSQQAKLLSKEACAYYVKAYPILHGNLWDPDRAKRIEKEISGCRQRP